MRYKHLQKANVDISALSVGTWGIGGSAFGEVDEDNSIQAVKLEVEHGVNLIDTAPVYGNGNAERIVGKAIRELNRSELFISTKFGIGSTTLAFKKCGKPSRDTSYDNVLFECEQSLRRLETDYIDFYFVHWPDPDVPIEETMDALNELKKEGKIRFAGVSNFSKEQIIESQKTCEIDVIQPPYSMVTRRDEELMKWCVEQGIGTFTYGTLGAGILSGKYRAPQNFQKGDVRGTFYPFFHEPQFSKVKQLLAVMDDISNNNGKPLSQIALNWATQKDYVSTALCGASKPIHALENCNAFDWMLTDGEMETLDEAIDKYIDFDGTAM